MVDLFLSLYSCNDDTHACMYVSGLSHRFAIQTLSGSISENSTILIRTKYQNIPLTIGATRVIFFFYYQVLSP